MAIEAKPSAYPEWNANTTGSGVKTQPPASLRDKGYDDTEKPWARHWNWLMNNIYLWLKYLYSLIVGSSDLALPTGVYIYDPVGALGTLSLEPKLVTTNLHITFLHANDRIVIGGLVRDAYTRATGSDGWGTSSDSYVKNFLDGGGLAAGTYYAYLDGDGVLQRSTVDPSGDATNFLVCSVDWDGSAVLDNLVDLRAFPAFEDPADSTRLLAADPTDALGAATKQYVDSAVTGVTRLVAAGSVTTAGAQRADAGGHYVPATHGTVTYLGTTASYPAQVADTVQISKHSGINAYLITLPAGKSPSDYLPPTIMSWYGPISCSIDTPNDNAFQLTFFDHSAQPPTTGYAVEWDFALTEIV